jgi:hypothetical protein
MNRKHLMLLTVAVLVMMSVILVTGSALADNKCGNSGPFFGENGLAIKKDVFCATEKVWDWNINKTVSDSSLVLSLGQQHTVNYTVTASAAASIINSVSGDIFVQNLSGGPVTLSGVSDSLADVDCPVSFPFVLPAGYILTCTYAGDLGNQPASNSATVTDASGYAVTATAAIDWGLASVSEIDECATVDDGFAGPLGTVCAGASTSFTFTYPRTIGPYDVCGEYIVNNTASFVTNDTISTGSDGAVVNVSVPCAGGCTLTPGYWKTHSAFGPAPYDDTWAMIGESTPFFFSGQSYYQVLWTPPSRGNAYYILAHAYIAAKLNQLNGANFSAAQSAFDSATALFSNPANTPASVGALRGGARNAWINLASILDNYNNGLIGPGHCSE